MGQNIEERSSGARDDTATGDRWQSRWFALDQGVLSYYKSEDEVKQGCKGSVNLSACEVIVHPADTLRIDLVVPYQQHFYLKAPTSQERHAWLVALFSAKAGQPPAIPLPKQNVTTNDKEEIKSKKSELRLTCDFLMKQVYNVKVAANNPEGPDLKALDDSTALLSATCDQFIKSLEQCLRLTEAKNPVVPVIERKSSRTISCSSQRQSISER